MKLRFPRRPAVFLAVAMHATAQTNPPPDPETALLLAQLAQQKSILDAQKALFDAQAAKAKSEQDLAKQLAAPDEAARTQRDTDISNAITKLDALAAKMPTGAVTTSSGMTATPATTALALRAMSELAHEVSAKIGEAVQQARNANKPGKPGKPVLVFVDKLPSASDTLQFQYWLESADVLERKVSKSDCEVPEAGGAKSQGLQTMSVATTAALIAALPGAINVVSGLFRSDYTEKTGDLSVDTAGFQPLVLAQLRAADKVEIYLSLDALAWSRLEAPGRLRVAERLSRLQAHRTEIGEATARLTAQIERLQATVDQHSRLKAALATLRSRVLELQERIASAGPGKDEPSERLLAVIEARAAAAQEEVTKLGNIASTHTAIAEARDKQRRLTALHEELTSFINSTVTPAADGQVKLLALMRSELLHQASYPTEIGDGTGENEAFKRVTTSLAERSAASDVFLVVLSVRHKPQSSVEKKSIWSRKYFASALIGVDFQVAQTDGRVIAADVRWRGYTHRLPEPDRQPTALAP